MSVRISGASPGPPVVRTPVVAAGPPPSLVSTAQPFQQQSASDPAPTKLTQHFTLDPRTQELVLQKFNERGDVVRQYPDEALLRMRAYAAAVLPEDPPLTAVQK